MTLPQHSRRDADRNAPGIEFNLYPGAPLQDKPLMITLYESIRDTIFPSRLPPLELTSKPIPVPDRMATRTNPWAVGTSTVVNGGILTIVLLVGLRAAINQAPTSPSGGHIDLSDITLFAPLKAHAAGGGGGGGSRAIIDPTEGRNPRLENTPITPPMIPLLEQPKLAVDSSIAVQNIRLPDNQSMPNIGVHSSPNVTLASNGQGIHDGIGTGANGGDGPGSGIGFGPGSDQGAGGGVFTPGGGVTAPIPIFAPEAEFSDEARRQKHQGVCLVSLIVDAHGNPQNPHVIQTLGMGLDEKALEAIRRYRFKPSMKDGKPVPVRITIEVDFRMF